MSDEEAVTRRLRAVERSLTDGDYDVDALREAGEVMERVESLESQLDDAADRIAELEAATQALRGYVGNVRSVNEDVEKRADAALATVERLEARIDDEPRAGHGDQRSPVRGRVATQRQPRTADRTDRDFESEPAAEAGGDVGGGFLSSVRDVL